MSSPTPEEIAYVLAAPEAVREALRRVDGPGWWLAPSPTAGVAVGLFSHPPPPGARAFLPVDPCAIAEAASRIAHTQGKAPHWNGPAPWMLKGLPDDEGPVLANVLDVAGCRAPSARLAALRLLGAVVAP